MCASNWTSASGPCFFATGAQARQRDRMIAADDQRRRAGVEDPRHAASIAAYAGSMPTGGASTSPASTIVSVSNGEIFWK